MAWTCDSAYVVSILVAEANHNQTVDTAGDPDTAADDDCSMDRHLGVVLQGVDNVDQAVYSNYTQGNGVDH